ncbi:MAG: hypothetical protein AAF492_01830 [Verrucomicrobiota bacterium]
MTRSTDSLLQKLYGQLFPESWQPPGQVTIAHPVLDAIGSDDIITPLFAPLLLTGEASLTITGIAERPPPPTTTLSFSGQATLFGSIPASLAATFSVLNPTTLTLNLKITPTDATVPLAQLFSLKLLPFTAGSAPPPISFPGVGFDFDASTASLAIASSTVSSYLQDLFPGAPITDVELDLLTIFDHQSGLKNYRALLGGKIQLGGTTFELQLQLPIGLLNWSLSIRTTATSDKQFNTKQLPSNIASFVSAIPSLLLEAVEDNFQLSYLTIQFSLEPSPTIHELELNLATTRQWEIIPSLFTIKQGLSLTLSGRPGSYSGQIQGQARIGSSQTGFDTTVVVPVPIGSGDIQVEASPNISQKDIWNVLSDLFGIPAGSLPPSLNPDQGLTLSHIGLSIGTAPVSLTSIALELIYADAWHLPWVNEVYLQEGLSLAFQFENLNGLKLSYGEVKGTMVFGSNQVGAALIRGDLGWSLFITSDEVILPGISDLVSFTGGTTFEQLLPAGIQQTGNFTLQDLNLDLELSPFSLKTFGFYLAYSSTSPPWVIVPDFLTINEFSVLGQFDREPDGSHGFSGYVSGVVTIASLPILLVANKDTETAPWVFTGRIDGVFGIHLTSITSHFKIPDIIVDALPTGIDVTELEVSVTPQNGNFSVDVQVTIPGTWPFALLHFQTAGIAIDKSSEEVGIAVNAGVALGTGEHPPVIKITGLYEKNSEHPDGSWLFTGSLQPGSPLDLAYLLHTFISPTLPVPAITINQLELTANTATQQYTFAIGGTWTIDFSSIGLGQLTVAASADLLYNKAHNPTYAGSKLQGTIQDFHGLSLGVAVDIAAAGTPDSYVFTFMSVTATLQKQATTTTLRFTLGEESLGSILTLLIEAAVGRNVTLPKPWNALNSVSLNDFAFIYTLAKTEADRTVDVEARLDLNLGFADLDSIGLVYRPGNPSGKKVQVKVTGSFIGINIDHLDAFDNWYADDPDSAPQPPGEGTDFFELNLLALGQHVQLPSSAGTVEQSIADMRNGFTKSTFPPLPSQVAYSDEAGWLVGTQFTLIKMIELSIVFNDPTLYGLLINVIGGKFSGLKFEILYKRINDHTGVYYLDFTLPDYLRHLEFGEVSVTLPNVKIWVYSNGGFTLDVGFPYNQDFSQSTTVQVFPFIGHGGFYFGEIKDAPVPHLPAVTADPGGEFNPIIVFGLGLALGAGNTIEEGPLSAGLEVYVEGILEGVIAKYNSYATGEDERALGSFLDGEHY